MKDGERHDLKEDLKKYGSGVMSKVADLCDGECVDFEPLVLKGIAHETIINMAEPGDLIVISNNGKSNIARFILGSVSDEVVHQAKCSVLVVKNDHE